MTYWTMIGSKTALGVEKKIAEMRYGMKGIIVDGLLFRVSSIDRDSADALWSRAVSSINSSRLCLLTSGFGCRSRPSGLIRQGHRHVRPSKCRPMGTSTALRLGFGLLTFVAMARMLGGPEPFGQLHAVVSVATLLTLVANFGFTPYVLREIGVRPQEATRE